MRKDKPYPREELEKVMDRWLAANKKAEAEGKWTENVGPFYAENAVYTWSQGPGKEVRLEGREQISKIALGDEMSGLEGWEYPCNEVIIDEAQGIVIGLWDVVCVSAGKREDGTPYKVSGMGGSIFHYAGSYRWDRQRDFYDSACVSALFEELAEKKLLSEDMLKRLAAFL